MRGHWLVIVALATAVPTHAAAQTPAARFIEGARQQIDELNADSAYALLQRGLDADNRATVAERQRGLVLLGIVALLRSNGADRIGARQAFELALRLDPAYALPDSLSDLHGDSRIAFAEARQLVPLPQAPLPMVNTPVALAVEVDGAADTTLAADSGRYLITVRPNRPARVIAVITPADVPSDIIWADTQQVQLAATARWNLRAPAEDSVVPEGRYALHVRAVDANDMTSGTIERILVVTRLGVDTAAHPEPLAPSAFQPETLRLRGGSPAALLVGLGVGAAAVLLPSALGNPDLNAGQSSDGTSMVIAGTASVAGIVGFLRGSRTRYSAENAQLNAETRQRWAAERDGVIVTNRQRRAAAPVRVRVE